MNMQYIHLANEDLLKPLESCIFCASPTDYYHCMVPHVVWIGDS